ncbi:MAG: CPA2 family monovalent cation:H+ antiporter-2 [Verrucomicrobiales bacterium]|jgi:CPA2 family monovalent cation:H+ antiporter-2
MFLAVGDAQIEGLFGALAAMLFTAIAVGLLLSKVRQSILVGYFVCGLMLGKSGLGVIQDEALIRGMADVGVILLMFTIGIAFSIAELQKLRRIVLIGGGLQLSGVCALGFGVATVLGFDWRMALFLGFVVAISSTALSLRIFQDLGQENSPAARIALGIAIFQDVAVVVFMVVMPALLAPEEGTSLAAGLAVALGKGVAFLVVSWLLSLYVFPPLLQAVSRTRSRELFTLSVLALCVGTGYLGSLFGLSVALGAFVAGVVVSESTYSHRILADILPFKDFFLTLFFISIGLMIDVRSLAGLWLPVAIGTVAILVTKTIVAFAAALTLRFPVRSCLTAALAVSSIGEFSLVLVDKAVALQTLSSEHHQVLLFCAAITMGLTPIAVRLGNPISKKLEGLKFLHRKRDSHEPEASHLHSKTLQGLSDHAVICGHGPVGEAVNEALRASGIGTIVIEMNVDTVAKLKKQSQLCIFGDVNQTLTLELAQTSRARLIVFSFPMIEIVEKAVKFARELHPDIVIMARAKFPAEVAKLKALGVDAVVHDELESGAEMTRRTMEAFECAPSAVAAVIEKMHVTRV